MERHQLGYSFVLVERACFYKGWLVVPLAMPNQSYSFAVMAPEDWTAAACDWRDYDSIQHSLSAGRRWVDGFLTKLPASLVASIEHTASLAIDISPLESMLLPG